MKLRSLALLVSFMSLVILAACSGASSKESEYPSKKIDFVVAAGPGGGTDIFARKVQKPLEEMFDTNINVLNLGTSSGVAAHEKTSTSKADGYTIEFASTTYISTLAAGQNPVGLDKLTPVARMQSDIIGLFINPKKYKDFDEFYKYAEENPGKVTVGGTHAVSPDEMVFLEFKKASGLEINYIPYDATGDSIANLLGGNIDAILTVYGSTQDYVDTGEINLALFFSDERLGDFPDVPVSNEYGWDVTNGNERGVFMHSDTPKEILEKVEAALKDIYDSEEYKDYEKQNQLHYREGWLGSEEYRKKLEEDLEKYKELLGK